VEFVMRKSVCFAAYCYITARCCLCPSNKVLLEIVTGLEVCACHAFCVARPLTQFNVRDHYHGFVELPPASRPSYRSVSRF
jgi:hypothetical protein